MATFTVAPVIPQEEYDRFFLLLKYDPEFPITYDRWVEKSTKDLRRRRKQGEVRELTIHHQEFAAWCEARGDTPCFALLEAFAVAKTKKKG